MRVVKFWRHIEFIRFLQSNTDVYSKKPISNIVTDKYLMM